MHINFISGMTVRQFKGISSLLEVECSAISLTAGVKIFSMKLFSVPDNILHAKANPLNDNCFTFLELTSCTINKSDTRKSKLRILVSDLKEGEGRKYGCSATSFDSDGDTVTSTWVIDVIRNSE